MFEAEVYQRAVETLIAWTIQVNEFNRKKRAEMVGRWYVDADIARAKKEPEPPQPEPPEPELSVLLAPGSIDQSTITVKVGPALVADATPLVLAEIPSYLLGKYPPNVTAISGRTSDGGIWTCYPEDTRPTGWIEYREGRKLEKVEGLGFGGIRKSFYYDRGPAE